MGQPIASIYVPLDTDAGEIPLLPCIRRTSTSQRLKAQAASSSLPTLSTPWHLSIIYTGPLSPWNPSWLANLACFVLLYLRDELAAPICIVMLVHHLPTDKIRKTPAQLGFASQHTITLSLSLSLSHIKPFWLSP